MTPVWWSDREDGRCGPTPSIVEQHGGTSDEVVRWSCRVRLPWHIRPRVRLVIRAYPSSANVTVALEALRTQ